MLLIFAFRYTIAEIVAKNLQTPAHKMYLDSTIEAVDAFIDSTDFESYGYVLGLGTYSGRDKDALRIETQCGGQFRNQKQGLQSLAIPYFLRPGPNIKLANGIGNSWCSLVSYKILTKPPNARYTFLHVPKEFDNEVATNILDEQLGFIKN